MLSQCQASYCLYYDEHLDFEIGEEENEKMNDRGNWLNNIIDAEVCIYTRRFVIFFYKSRISLLYSRLSNYMSGITIGKLTYTDHLFLIWKI